MANMRLPLIRGDKQSDLDYTDLLPVNLTSIVREVKGDQGYLLANDGLVEFSEVGGVSRGGYYNERMRMHFRVSGSDLESIGIDGSVTRIGNIPGNSVCQFASSFNTQAILTEGRLFLYDGATLAEIKDPDLGAPIDITWFRGVYVMTDGEYVFQTDILDEYSISPLKYVTSEFSNDPTVAVKQTSNNQIIAFNRTSIEFFYFNPNAATGTSVLAPVQGKSNKVGIGGVNCVVEMSGVYFCLGSRENESNKFYVVASTGVEQEISTRYINESILAKLDINDISDVYLESRYKDGQHVMICHLPSCTLIYNHTIAQKMGLKAAWSVAKSSVDGDSEWRAKYGVFDARISKWIYGDKISNKLGELSGDTMAQYGEHQECIAYTPIAYLDGNIVMQDITLQNIPGYVSDDATLFWSFTDDGQSYGQESTFIMSSEYKYKNRVVMRNNGLFKELMGIKFRFVSRDKQALSGVSVNYRARSTS